MSNSPAESKIPLDQWIAREAIPLEITSKASFAASVDRILAIGGQNVDLLGFGEALHGGEEILRLRNRLFQHLVETQEYSAIAIESSFPRARMVNDYIHGRGPASYEELIDTGFGNGMGQLEANRELVEWMRTYNLRSEPTAQLNFYGFDIPSGNRGVASPGQVLDFVVDYLALTDPAGAESHRRKIHDLLGDDAQWENPAVYMDPSQSIALSPSAAALRIETEDLIAELRSRRPELVVHGGEDSYREALQYGNIARQLLNFHAAMASRQPGQSPAIVLGTRDATMADNLTYIVDREHGRGKVLVFAHNSHLQRGQAAWPGQKYWGTEDECEWWPAGSHLTGILGSRYFVIGSAVAVSRENGISEPEPGTLEARLNTLGHPTVFLPTRGGNFYDLSLRTGSVKNPTYVPLNARVATHFDGIVQFADTPYNRGGPPLDAWETPPNQNDP